VVVVEGEMILMRMRMRMRMPRILLLRDHYKNLRLHQEGSRALALSFVPDPEEEQLLWWCQLKASCIMMLMLCPVQGAVKWSITNAPLAASGGAFFFYLWYYCCQGGECKLTAPARAANSKERRARARKDDQGQG
jgi:hypothetical protein